MVVYICWKEINMEQELDILQHYKTISSKLKKYVKCPLIRGHTYLDLNKLTGRLNRLPDTSDLRQFGPKTLRTSVRIIDRWTLRTYRCRSEVSQELGPNCRAFFG